MAKCEDCGCCPCNKEDCDWCGDKVAYRQARKSMLTWLKIERKYFNTVLNGPEPFYALHFSFTIKHLQRSLWCLRSGYYGIKDKESWSNIPRKTWPWEQ